MTEWAPATEAEAAMRDALRTEDQELYFRILARTELLLPVSSEAIAGRAPMGWGTWTAGDRTHVLAFTSPEAMHACLAEHAGSARKIPYHELAAAWPNLEWWLAVNPGLPIEGYLPAWFVSQLARGDVRLPGRNSGNESPVRTSRAEALQREAPPEREPTMDRWRNRAGRARVPTRGAVPAQPGPGSSMGSPPEASPDSSATPEPAPPVNSAPPVSSAPPNVESWFDPVPAREPETVVDEIPPALTQWVLDEPDPLEPDPTEQQSRGQQSLGQGSPGQEPSEPAGPDPLVGYKPANDLEAELVRSASAGTPGGLLSVLLLAKVLLPVAEGADPAVRPGAEGFAWRTEKIDNEPYVVTFTSRERMDEHLSEPAEAIAIRFVQLIRAWPDPAWSLAVNPGTPIGATLPGAQIAGLVSSAAEVGLDDDAGEARESAAGTAGAGSAYAEVPISMQKVVAPSQVEWYLERGYDRVSGFVHRATEVAHLTSPAKLVAALGLRYEDSPFSAEADEIFVLRWHAYCPHLYRIPYGGRTETAMSAMQGWVIERAPFRGNGFAPADSSDVIAEFKVDSIRLPHGAQLWKVPSQGDMRLVATLDTDSASWRREEEPDA